MWREDEIEDLRVRARALTCEIIVTTADVELLGRFQLPQTRWREHVLIRLMCAFKVSIPAYKFPQIVSVNGLTGKMTVKPNPFLPALCHAPVTLALEAIEAISHLSEPEPFVDDGYFWQPKVDPPTVISLSDEDNLKILQLRDRLEAAVYKAVGMSHG